MDDLDLLKAYLDHQDQDAFAQLVRRHTPWLYAAAKRQLGDPHLAEDVKGLWGMRPRGPRKEQRT